MSFILFQLSEDNLLLTVDKVITLQNHIQQSHY